jgi:MFS transporter, OFA family, oxalate/formate antiporter
MADRTRWFQLILGLVCMVVISSPQYVWALFTTPMTAALGVELAQLQITFSLLIVLQTFLAPCQGFLIDRFGPRLLLSLGAILTGLSWMLAARVDGLLGIYLTYGVLGGIGTGIVYIGVVGHMVQWFPDRRGFATGMVAAGYGIGALLTTWPISNVVRTSTYQQALAQFGIIFAVVGFLAAQGLRRPTGARTFASPPAATSRLGPAHFTPAEMLRTPVFWLMFVMMTMMSTSGLMVISQMGAFTRGFRPG